MLVPRSPFLKDLMASQRCQEGVNIYLAGVKADTCQRLVDYLYTGTCRLDNPKQVKEIDQLKNILQLEIDIEKKWYRIDSQEDDDDSDSNSSSDEDSSDSEDEEDVSMENVKPAIELEDYDSGFLDLSQTEDDSDGIPTIPPFMLLDKGNKRSRSHSKEDSPKKKIRETLPKAPAPLSHRSGGSSAKEVNTKLREGSEEEKNKRSQNENIVKEVRVSEDSMSAENKEKKKGAKLCNLSEHNSPEYKHEFKKARDRLYKRKLRELRAKGIMSKDAAQNIPKADIEVEMLVRYKDKANKTSWAEIKKGVKKQELEPPMQKVRVKAVTSVLDNDLDLSDLSDNEEKASWETLPLGMLIGDGGTFGGTNIEDIVSKASEINLPDASKKTTKGMTSVINEGATDTVREGPHKRTGYELPKIPKK